MAAQNSSACSRISNSRSAAFNPAVLRAPAQKACGNGASTPATFVGFESCNAILSALPADVRQRWSPHLRRVLLYQNDVLHECGREVKHAYFVEKGLISLVTDARCGAQFEVAVIGCEGMTGALSVLGNRPGVHSAMVQVAGKAYRLPLEVLRVEWQQNPDLQSWTLGQANLLMAQASQNALCSRIHILEARLSCWLLTVRDRLGCDELYLTHDSIARMLGVRRSGVTIALGAFQKTGLIECGRGHIVIKDAQALGQSACECYDTLRRQFQLFGNCISAGSR
jgi:CRP-like cAMP-binding protein